MRRALAVVAVVVAVVGVLLAGCGGEDEQDQLVDTLRSDFDMDAEQAECVADQLFERFRDDEIEELREAGSSDDLSEEQLADLRAALTPCASAGS